MNFSRSSMTLHSFQGTFALLAKGQKCNPCHPSLGKGINVLSEMGQPTGLAIGSRDP